MPVTPAAPTTADLETMLTTLWPTYEQALQDLIRIPSLLGAETGAQEQVALLAEGAGLDVEVWDVDPAELARHPDYAPWTAAKACGRTLRASYPAPGVVVPSPSPGTST